MKKYLLTACLFGTVSCISAADEDRMVSPTGQHGMKHGGMCTTVYKSSDNMALVTTFPPAVRVHTLGADGSSYVNCIFPISTQTRVVDFKAEVLTKLRVPAASRFMFKGFEIMKKNVDADNRLLTLGDIFQGVVGMPNIQIVFDKSRSPMMTPMPQPVDGKVPPLKGESDSE